MSTSGAYAAVPARRGASWAAYAKLALLFLGVATALLATGQSETFWAPIRRLALGEQAAAPAAAVATPIPAWAPWLAILAAAAYLWNWANKAKGRAEDTGLLSFLARMRPMADSARISAQNAGFIGMAVVSAVLVSFASLYTTFVGSLSFFGYQPQQVLFGLALALGIQGVCYMASWFVAEELATRGRRGRGGEDGDWGEPEGQGLFVIRHFGKVLMLCIAMAASIFFSFAAHFENVYGPKRLELANLQNAREDTTRVFVAAEKAIIAERDDVSAGLRDGAAWKEFNSKLNAMLKLAEDNPAFVQAQVKTRRAQADGELGKTRADLRNLREDRERIAGEIGKTEALSDAPSGADPGASEKRVKDLAGRLDEAKAQHGRLDLALKTERGPGNDPANVPEACRSVAEAQARGATSTAARRPNSGLGGRTRAGNGKDGPVSRCIAPLVAEAKIKVDILERDLRRLTDDNRTRMQGSAARAQTIGELKAKKLELDGKIATLESRERQEEAIVKSVESSTEQIAAASGAEIGKRVGAERDAFLRVGSKELFNAMVQSCGSLNELLRSGSAEITAKMPQGACDTSGFSAQVDRMVTLDAALQQFRAACKVDNELNNLPTPMDFVRRGSSCLALAKVPDRLRAENAAINSIAQLNHPDASNFERSVGSLKRGDTLAWLAAALAVAVDLIVFLSAVLGAQHDATPLMRQATLDNKESVKDILSGFVDATVHGDEDGEVMTAKWFIAACKTVLIDGRAIHSLDMRDVPADRAQAIRHIVNSVSGPGAELARPRDAAGLVYEIDHSVYLHCARAVADFEKRRARSEGPRQRSTRGEQDAIARAFFDHIGRRETAGAQPQAATAPHGSGHIEEHPPAGRETKGPAVLTPRPRAVG